MVHAAIERIQPGDVLVLAMPEPRPIALLGDLLATQVKVRGAAAILVDAAVRDVEELQKLGLPIWTRFIRAKGTSKTESGALDSPIMVGGTRISPGDIVVLDADGGVSIPMARSAEVLVAAEARCEREARLRENLVAGATSYDLHGLRAHVESNRRGQDAC
jgi:4-hydroxy-4-methyl-2-oxoglutarate aldolase